MLIIRRGPSRVFHLIAWDTETDRLEHGSWFRGKLYPHRCDLSFDGQWLVYFAFGPTRDLYSWVAVSRPPWLRAEALWPKEDCWRGGGVFLGPQRLWLNLAPDARPRPNERDPRDLGLQIEQWPAAEGEDEGSFFYRLERDGWKRAGDWSLVRQETTPQGWLCHGDPGWFLRPSSHHPTLRMFYRGYYFRRGRVYEYAIEEYPGLIDPSVEWAGWDGMGRLVIARAGFVERYTLEDLAAGAPSFRYDLNALVPPPRPPSRPRPPRRASVAGSSGRPRLAQPGGDARGRYLYLGDRDSLRRAVGRTGYPIRSQVDLREIASILRAESGPPFGRPQIYVVTLDGAFVLGGELGEDVVVAGGKRVLAAGEVMLDEDASGHWRIVSINNRSYGYMPDAASWAAVDAALSGTGIPYPQEGFSECYPLEGTWAELLEILRK
jgi:hypothetical protein